MKCGHDLVDGGRVQMIIVGKLQAAPGGERVH